MAKVIIAITADVHYGSHTDEEELRRYISFLNQSRVDYLVIGGDLISRGGDHPDFRKALSAFKRFRGMILMTPGNHDLWTVKGNSWGLLKNKLPDVLEDYGHRLLDGKPMIIGGLGIAGSVGWYDYSFRRVPAHLDSLFQKYTFRFGNGENNRVMNWNQLTEKEYEGKRCIVSDDGEKWKKSTWEDKRFIKWDYTDKEFLNIINETLEKDLEYLSPRVDRIIVVTHHLPYIDFVPDIPDPTWGFHRAFLGSDTTGRILGKFPKVKEVYCGHSHRDQQKQINGINARNIYFKTAPGTYMIEVES